MLERLFPQQADDRLFVEDVFSTYLYTGTGSAQTITNGIDLAGKGGLIWSKGRSGTSGAERHNLFDTARGKGSFLSSNSANEQFTFTSDTQDLTSFNSNGFSVGIPYNANVNQSSTNYATWTFREAPNFFDVVTYTGNGANRTIAHNLGVAPGMILVKRTDTTGDWEVYHQSLGPNQSLALNLSREALGSSNWGNTTPTATQFSVGSFTGTNASGGTYVAYLFAHDPSSDGIIQCGSFTTDGSGVASVTLGWEPQWVLVKAVNNTFNWEITDTMRGMSNPGSAPLFPNLSSAESSFPTGTGCVPNATGFTTSSYWGANREFIYVAIRRGPMRTPTLGTSVFSPNRWFSTTGSAITTNFPVDFQIGKNMGGADNNAVTTRLISMNTTTTNSSQLLLKTNLTDAETATGVANFGFNNTGFLVGPDNRDDGWAVNFRRAPGFMDVVCFTPAAVTGTAVKHNLGVVPELVISKSRTAGTGPWVVAPIVYGNGQRMRLNTADASAIQFNTGYPATSTEIYENAQVGNFPAAPWVAYLFASVPGVSKVGTYTGNGSSQTINCAFTTGARFVLIKRTDSTGDWYVWDSARGIVAGNDPYLALNTTAAEVTSNDSVDTDSTGFIVNQVAASNINVNGATYIFLSIA